jgi:hypothetical protein
LFGANVSRWNPPHQHQQALKLTVVAIAFPKIDELADNLEVSHFIVAVAVDPIDRRQQVFVRVGAMEMEGDARRDARFDVFFGSLGIGGRGDRSVNAALR